MLMRPTTPRTFAASAAVLALALVVVGLAGCRDTPGSAPTTSTSTDTPTLANQNAERTSRGLAALAWDARLQAAAQEQAAWCAKIGQLTHTGFGGTNVGQRVTRQGVAWQAAAENAAWAGWPESEAEAVAAWMRSPGHRANLLGPYSHVGAASADDGRGGRYWVSTYAR